MKRYDKLIEEGLRLFDTFYATEENKQEEIDLGIDRARKCGYVHIKCFRVRTDTKGLLMFETWVNRE